MNGLPPAARSSPSVTRPGGGSQPTNLADILERVLDKGIVVAGDIQVNLLDIELLTIRLRLLVASVDRAREMGIDWWEHDPSLSSGNRRREVEQQHADVRARSAELERENRELRERLDRLEAALETGSTDRRTNGSTNRRTNGSTNRRTNGSTNRSAERNANGDGDADE